MEQEIIARNIAVFRELMACTGEIPIWHFDGEGRLVESNCPDEALLAEFLEKLGCLGELCEYGKKHSKPLFLGTAVGLNWLAAYEKEGGRVAQIYALGPFLTSEVSVWSVERGLQASPLRRAGQLWKREFLRAVGRAAVLSQILINQYGVMLHYCVTGERIGVSDISAPQSPATGAMSRTPQRSRQQVWLGERNMLRMVREGDLNYKDALDQVSRLSGGVPVRSKDPLQQAKVSVITSVTLCSRAAIEGGLPPDIAYSIGDTYLQNAENCATVAELAALNYMMFDDFVQRVHRLRINPRVSRQIQLCCDYIETHPEQKITLQELAKMAGYTEYYLSRKFAAEVGTSVNDYIKIAKVERAKFLLSTTNAPIQEIYTRLEFCSRSHFGETFRKLVGCSPAEYRERQR